MARVSRIGEEIQYSVYYIINDNNYNSMNGRRPTAAVQHTSQSKRASRVGDGGRGRGAEAGEDPSQVELNTVLRGKSRWRSTVQSESDLNQRLHSEVKVKANSRLSTD